MYDHDRVLSNSRRIKNKEVLQNKY